MINKQLENIISKYNITKTNIFMGPIFPCQIE